MNRRNRTLLVLVVAVGLASLATYGVFRTIKSIPVRQVEVATKHVVVAAENLPLGTRVSKEQRQGCRLAGGDARRGELCLGGRGRRPRADFAGAGQ